MYYDGVLQNLFGRVSTPSGTFLATQGDDWTFGNEPGGVRGFNGYMAEIALWNRILGEDEILALAGGFAPTLFLDGLVGYCPCKRDDQDLIGGEINGKWPRDCKSSPDHLPIPPSSDFSSRNGWPPSPNNPPKSNRKSFIFNYRREWEIKPSIWRIVPLRLN